MDVVAGSHEQFPGSFARAEGRFARGLDAMGEKVFTSPQGPEIRSLRSGWLS